MEICKPILLILPWLLSLLDNVSSLPLSIRSGVLYEPKYASHFKALYSAASKFNMKKETKESKYSSKKDNRIILLLDGDSVQPQDSFSAQRKVCRMANIGVSALFGPMSSLSAAHVRSICNTLEIPQIQWHWDPRDSSNDYFSINLFPHYLTLSTSYKDAIKHWKWNRFTILYESNEGLTRVQEVLKVADDTPENRPQITVRLLELENGDYVTLLKKLKDEGEFRFVVDCSFESVLRFLNAALKLAMTSELFHYFFTTLDLGLLDLTPYSHAGANITGYRLIDPERLEVINVRTNWLIEARNGEETAMTGFTEIPTETALAYDALTLYAKGLERYSQARVVHTSSLGCDKTNTWEHGAGLLNYIKASTFEGLSGTVKYEDGERYDFNLDLMFLRKSNLEKIGHWNRKNGLTILGPPNKTIIEEPLKGGVVSSGSGNSTTKKKYRVAAYVIAPYVIRNESTTHGYDGFCVQLLTTIAKKRGFDFEIVEMDTRGKELPNKTWTGVMGALMHRTCDIGIGDLTINLLREKHVDFTKPFLTLGITILYKKPAPKSLNLFSFLSPLSVDVWVYMIAAYLCVSLMLFVIARFSPYEWCNPHPCNPDTDEVENQFTVMNSLWFTIGSLMQQGCEIAPRALSTRLVAGMWWFFTLIMISSYTANLAAFLTVERMVADIGSAEDLAKQTKIKYGVPDGGATMAFFKQNSMPLYERMWNFMNSTSDISMVKNQTNAIEMVKKGGFAFITESTTVQYIYQRNCELMQIGGLLDSKGYGFATPTGSPVREMLTEEILRLKEEQIIEKYRVEWWEKKLGGGKCNREESTVAGKAAELGVENVGGVFVVLIGGVVIGFIVSICEFVWKANKNAKKDNQTLCSEMSEEFRFAVHCCGSVKKKTQPQNEITDNGLQFMPLTGYHMNSHGGKEVYA